MSRRGARAAGFTLIELMAAVFLTTVVLSLAWAIFLNLSSGLETARERVRESRHALAILDRVARDLGGTYLLAKPPELDPLFHPWVFLAESHTESPGSDRVKFITRSHRPRNPLGHGSDLAVVTYVLEHADGGRYVLTRSLSPGLPEELDREFPTGDDHHTMVVAEGVASFGVRFLNDQQEWVDEWDSSLITESGELPLVAEIDLALAPPGDEEDDFGDLGSFDGDDLERFTRRVLLPIVSRQQAPADGGNKQHTDNGAGKPHRCKVKHGEALPQRLLTEPGNNNVGRGTNQGNHATQYGGK